MTTHTIENGRRERRSSLAEAVVFTTPQQDEGLAPRHATVPASPCSWSRATRPLEKTVSFFNVAPGPVALAILLAIALLAGMSLACTSTTAPPAPGDTPLEPPQIPPTTIPGTAPPDEPGEVPVDPLPPPSAAEVIAAYVDAVGGEEALHRHTSMRAKGSFEMPSMGLTGDLDISTAAPNLLLVRVSLPGVGEILQGFDGEVAWSDNPMTGPAIMEGEARDDAVRQADFYPELNYAVHYPEMETLERQELDGQQVYKVRLVDSAGKESFHYFDVESGLLVATEGEQDTPMGRVFVSTRVGGYREFDGRLVATELDQSTMGMEQSMTIEEIEFNGVDEGAFALPETIRALAE